jgi:hypothetical protein
MHMQPSELHMHPNSFFSTVFILKKIIKKLRKETQLKCQDQIAEGGDVRSGRRSGCIAALLGRWMQLLHEQD